MKSLALVILLLNAGFLAAQQLPWPTDPFGDDYRVDATYGPRTVSKGTFFHKGIDLNQQGTGGATGGNDLNLPLVAAANGTIFGIGWTSTDGIYWIGIDYGGGRSFSYLHIFPTKDLYTGDFRVFLNNTIAKNNEIKSYRRVYTSNNKNRGIILFYSELNNKGRVVKALGIEGIHSARVQISTSDYQDRAVSDIEYPEGSVVVSAGIDAVLETTPAVGDVYSDDKTKILVGPNRRADTVAGYVAVSTSVVTGEIIAPLGSSGASNSHLHLQVSHPDPVLANDPALGNDYNDGWDNVVQHLVHSASAFAGGISVPAAGGTVYHTSNHDFERVTASIRQSLAGINYQTFHGYELDRVKMFAIPAEIAEWASEPFGLVADDAYLINRGRSPNTRVLEIPNPADPFRAEFDYGGSIGGGGKDNPFPPFLSNTGIKSKSINAKTTGLWPQGELYSNPVTDFVFNQWNTRLHKDFSGTIPGASDLALRSEDAAYPDGDYALVATAESVDRDPLEKFVSVPIMVGVDNFRPYAEYVEVKDAQGDVKYRRSWTLEKGALVSAGPTADEPLLAGGEYTVTALFSEFMEWGQLQVEFLDPMYPVETPLPALKKTIYTGSFTFGAGQDRDELRPLIITGRDIGANDVLKLDPGKRSGDGREDPERTINPALELTRNDAGDMQGIGGEDRFHTLRIDAASPVISYNKQSKRYSAFDYTCPGGVPERCGTEEAPIYITFSSVPFLYTDLGSGIGSVTVYKERLGGERVFPLESSSALSGSYSSGLTLPLKDGKYVQVVTDNLGRGT